MTFSMVGALEAVLYDVDLSVTGTILKGAYLSGAIIRHAQRFSANLAWADCSYADFRGTHMRYVNAGNTSFWHANDPILSYSNLDLANFQGVDLHKTVLNTASRVGTAHDFLAMTDHYVLFFRIILNLRSSISWVGH